ncbi:MAG: YggS family pyridoxal phosphate-dependent enzyme [Chloroflexi bacterium]|nr:YggS family pyridoxal phosphate-dependent enzyme [Chloroflexota bacterium]MCI0579134.1 YggS family pyridoxal phosphate-dependent enzyme [Chloroflexota bacterium]MCI0643351.1 YggS family pyridoxal phosphate-dependent enzyme [Chloroflexota bacterium]MCI0728330.1 YggS family pyridoxal phosphate-dependent enzyme [Chloroflexota bacterium]
MTTIAERYAALQEQIAQAAARAGRRPEAITLVAVTKTWPAAVVVAAYQAGMRHFGENRPEELAAKRPEVEARLGRDSGITWHLIGPVQSRKSDLAADYADVFHALDRLKIARRLSERLQENGRGNLPVFLEVNVSGEAAKAGLECSRWEEEPAQRRALQEVATAVAGLPGLQPLGLMTMAPWQVEEATIRSVFRRTKALAEWLQAAVPQAGWSALSMGMTDDFVSAIEEGATHIRVGRALFGPRSDEE